VRLGRGPLSLVSTIEELLGRKSSGSGLEIREYDCREPSRSSRGILTSPTSGGRSVGIVRSRTQATDISFSFSSAYRLVVGGGGITLTGQRNCPRP
jgi:hypothetical protein